MDEGLLAKETVKNGMLHCINTIRRTFSREELQELPPGVPKKCDECSGTRALAGLGFPVYFKTHSLEVPAAFASTIAAVLGTKVISSSEPSATLSVELPLSIRCFIDWFDGGHIPELIESQVRPKQPRTLNRRGRELATV